jgi:hypothetical protein
MPNTFPCPNAQCAYQFDADMLPAAAMVTCPLCRTRFPYRANRPSPGPEPVTDPRQTAPRMVHLRNVPQSSGILTTLLWVGGFSIVLAGVVAAVLLRGQHSSDTSPDVTSERYNLRIEPFPPAWEDDPAVRRPVGANILGRRRANPDGWIAVAAKDWGDRHPRTGELNEFLQGPLRSSLGTPFFQAIEGEKWAGQPALAYQFAGNLEDAQVRGEAYAISYKGIGYAFYAWTADADWEAHRADLVALRERMHLAGHREQWVERRSNVVVHTPDADAGYVVEDPDSVWVRGKPKEEQETKDKVPFVVDDVKALDPAATMALRARYQPRERGDAMLKPIEVIALVVELPKAGEALDAAQAHVIDRIKRDYAGDAPPELKLEPMAKSPAGIALPTGGPAIARYRFQDPFDRENRVMWIVSAIAIGDKTVAVETHVPEKDASYVEEWMVHLAGSLRAK